MPLPYTAHAGDADTDRAVAGSSAAGPIAPRGSSPPGWPWILGAAAVVALGWRSRSPIFRILACAIAGGLVTKAALARDRTLALRADPYRFIARGCEARGTDAFTTRLLLERTVCMMGAPAAQLFYGDTRFQRSGAVPDAIRATLLGKGGVQGLDGPAHRHRKALFLRVLDPARVAMLANRVHAEWLKAIPAWQARGQVALYDAVQDVLTRAVCAWAQVPLPEPDVGLRRAQLVSLFDRAAAGPARHLGARLARGRLERWLAGLIVDVRNGALEPGPDCAVYQFAQHRDEAGELLAPRIAAVELLNILRPTVAVSTFIAFSAHALHRHAQSRDILRRGTEPRYLDAFVQEVRRHYPFFPAAIARASRAFEWNGVAFARGERALLDLHGTNHDPRLWDVPGVFDPLRFIDRTPGAYEFIAQGGGDPQIGHRCPGEGVTIELMKVAVDCLVNRMTYEVSAQNLRIAMNRLPALPRDSFLIERVRAV